MVSSSCDIDMEVTEDTEYLPLCICEGGDDGEGDGDDVTCYYETSVDESVAESAPWRTYVVLCELMMRILPCCLLVVLNFLMVR